jgi:NADH:ubiquinone oxidoreductase subunit 4 (subunit M)
VINTYYNFWFFNRVSFGNLKKELVNSEIVSSITKREFYILFYLVFFIVFFGFMPGLLLINLENFTIFTILRVLY